ncbi:hypothetical protein [Thiosocius teredinicola]|uniref:hypothetical protein n=1 Tax=Thiosocius teredinicola TaxID=1973002 RepID=UPI000F789E4A
MNNEFSLPANYSPSSNKLRVFAVLRRVKKDVFEAAFRMNSLAWLDVRPAIQCLQSTAEEGGDKRLFVN